MPSRPGTAHGVCLLLCGTGVAATRPYHEGMSSHEFTVDRREANQPEIVLVYDAVIDGEHTASDAIEINVGCCPSGISSPEN